MARNRQAWAVIELTQAVIFLGVFCSGLAYIFWYDGLEVLPVAQVGAFVYLEPFVTVVFAAIFLAEPLLLASVLGGVAVLSGVWLVQKKLVTRCGPCI